MDLDQIDIKILKILQTEGRIKTAALADAVGLSPTPCARRLKQLEDSGVIQQYVAVLDQKAVGLPISIFVSVELKEQTGSVINEFERHVSGFEEVMECYLMTGSQDFLLRMVAADLEAYEHFLQDKLVNVPGVQSIRSRFALRRSVHRNALPMDACAAR